MNWFRIRTDDGDEGHNYVGSSVDGLDTLGQRAASGHYVRLDNLLHDGSDGDIDGTDTEDDEIPSVLINPRHIISIVQLKDDPRTNSRPGG